MSFILDALRKSEAERRRGQVPALDTPDGSPPPRKPRRNGWLLAVLTAVVLGGAGLFAASRTGWIEQRLVGGDTIEQSRATPGADTPERGDTPPQPPAEQPVAESPSSVPTVAPAPDDGADAVDFDKPQPGSDRRERRPGAPAPADRSVSRPAPKREYVTASSEEALRELERRYAQQLEQRDSAPAGKAAADSASDQKSTSQADGEPAKPAAPERSEIPETAEPRQPDTPWRSDVPEYVRAWELPLSVRRSLPDLSLSIHVFAPEARDRFVLINGERYRPGDRIDGDTRLVDIRREGAIVDFREHRFLIEP